MQNQNQLVESPVKRVSKFFRGDKVQEEFTKLLGAKAPNFIASILSQVNSSTNLANVDQNSIYGAAMIAASLDLPINPNLGFAYIIPYGKTAQFQIGYKGLIQLAHRSKQYTTLHSSDVRQGELVGNNRMTGEMIFDWIVDDNQRNQLPIIGFVSYFKFVNGFESTFYMSIEEMQAHAKKYSKNFAKYQTGLWKDDFVKMSEKTITKLHLSKKGILSTELERAITFDQAAIQNATPDKSFEENLNIQDIEPEYVDNQHHYEEELQAPQLEEESEDEYNTRILNEQLAKEQEQERKRELANNPQASGQSHGGINVSMDNIESVIDNAKAKQKLK